MSVELVDAGTVSVTANGRAVTGVGTSWSLTVEPGDMLVAGAAFGFVASVESDTELTLAKDWAFDAVSSASYAIFPAFAHQNTVKTNRLLREYAERLVAGIGFQPDATGSIAERGQFDDEAKGFFFADVTVNPFMIYAKLSAASGDWSTGNAWLQRGETGDDGKAGAAFDYSGSGDPASGLGENGNTYLDLLDGATWLKTAGTWNEVGSIRNGPTSDAIRTASAVPVGGNGLDFIMEPSAPVQKDLPAAGVAGAGWFARFTNIGTRGAELASANLVDGQGSVWVRPGQTALLLSNGATWTVVDLTRMNTTRTSLLVYVDHAFGDDTNDGLAPGAGNAFATIQAAANFLSFHVDCRGYGSVIEVARQTFTEGNVSFTFRTMGYHVVSLRGRNAGGGVRATWNVPDNNTGSTMRDYTAVIVVGFRMESVTGSAGTTGFSPSQYGIADFDDLEWGDWGAGTHIDLTNGGSGGYVTGTTERIEGNFGRHWRVNFQSALIVTGTTHELPNALTFTDFLDMSALGTVIFGGVTFTGAGAGSGSTGRQYAVETSCRGIANGVVLPGATPGVTYTGVVF